MSAASYVGRIGGLAVALGVGAAVFTGGGIACAQPAASGSSSGSDASGSGTHGSSGTGSESDKTSCRHEDDERRATSKDACDVEGRCDVGRARRGRDHRQEAPPRHIGGHPGRSPQGLHPEAETGDQRPEPETTAGRQQRSPDRELGRHDRARTRRRRPEGTGCGRRRAAAAPSCCCGDEERHKRNHKVAETPAKKTPLSSVSVGAQNRHHDIDAVGGFDHAGFPGDDQHEVTTEPPRRRPRVPRRRWPVWSRSSSTRSPATRRLRRRRTRLWPGCLLRRRAGNSAAAAEAPQTRRWS